MGLTVRIWSPGGWAWCGAGLLVFASVLAACEGNTALLYQQDLHGGAGGAVGVGGMGVGGIADTWGTGGVHRHGSGGAPGPAGTGGAAVGTGGRGVGGSAPDASVDLPGGANGTMCNVSSDCRSASCVSGLCCDTACAGPCNTCAATPGTCTPRAKGESCGSAALCDSTGSKLVAAPICDGAGACAPGVVRDCGGFVCMNATCETSCASDADCASGRFCSARTCVAPPVNLAGNGDAEHGTTLGWAPFGGTTALNLSSVASGGVAHSGQYSVGMSGRGQNYQGPSYDMPTGIGKYSITAFGMQQTDPMLTGVLQLALTCHTTSQYLTIQSAGFGIPLPMGAWAQLSGPVDFSTLPADCQPTASPPGVIRRAQIYLNQTGSGVPIAQPDLFLDDVVIQSFDGHNLVGNPNFDAGLTDGWTSSTGTVRIASPSTTGSGHSLSVTGRTTSDSGPTYALPTGTARYQITLYAMHTGTSNRALALQAAYTCAGGSQTLTPAIAVSLANAANVWTRLAGTVTLPPPDAPAGCRMTLATVSVTQQETGTCTAAGGTVDCPDLYIDDVSITLAP